MDILVEVGADISICVSDSNLVLLVSGCKCTGYSWHVVSELSDVTGFRHVYWGCFDCLCQVPDVSCKGLGSSGEHSVCWLPGQLLTVVRNQPHMTYAPLVKCAGRIC